MVVLLEIGGVREACSQSPNFINTPLSMDPRAAPISSVLVHVCILVGRWSNVIQVKQRRGLREGGRRLSRVDFYRESLTRGGIMIFELGWRTQVNDATLDGVSDIINLLRMIFLDQLRLKLLNLRV